MTKKGLMVIENHLLAMPNSGGRTSPLVHTCSRCSGLSFPTTLAEHTLTERGQIDDSRVGMLCVKNGKPRGSGHPVSGTSEEHATT